MSPIPSIYSFTSSQFVTQIAAALGKGKQHALYLYREWYKEHTANGAHPAFNNAAVLLQEMKALADFSLLESSYSAPQPSLQPFSAEPNAKEPFTGKFLVQTADHYQIEAVCIPMQAGNTLCVSSQVGCRMGCTFCETGRMGLLRQLRADEIVQQVAIAKRRYHFEPRNIVFMGMGEPFDNYDEVMQAVRILTDPHGFAYGCQRITISTSGRVDGIERLLEEKDCPVNLAVSINAPNSQLRRSLMPIDRRYNLQTLKEALQNYNAQTGKQVLIAYVLMQGVNDSVQHAQELAAYLQGLSVKINVIPYNPQSSSPYTTPEMLAMEQFLAELRQNGYRALLRKTKGDKIMAACGQLGNPALKRKLSLLKN